MDGVRKGLFPAEAGLTMRARCFSGTGFSRESFTRHTVKLTHLQPCNNVQDPAALTL
jgi:hypothetical protein